MPLALAAPHNRGMEGTALPVRTRIFATALELLPFLGLLALSNDWNASFLEVVLLMATGTGWAVIGRWDTGCILAFVRAAIMVLAFFVALLVALQDLNCEDDCRLWVTVTFYTIISVAFTLTTGASALLVALQTRRSNPAR